MDYFGHHPSIPSIHRYDHCPETHVLNPRRPSKNNNNKFDLQRFWCVFVQSCSSSRNRNHRPQLVRDSPSPLERIELPVSQSGSQCKARLAISVGLVPGSGEALPMAHSWSLLWLSRDLFWTREAFVESMECVLNKSLVAVFKIDFLKQKRFSQFVEEKLCAKT